MTRLPVLVCRYFSVAVNEFYQIVLLQKINIDVLKLNTVGMQLFQLVYHIQSQFKSSKPRD